jgi:hypothetical protein
MFQQFHVSLRAVSSQRVAQMAAFLLCNGAACCSHNTGRYGMLTLHLDEQEQLALTELLEREVPNLRHEIHHTDDRDYREFLKERERVVEKLLAMVRTQTTGTPSDTSDAEKHASSL